MKVTMLFWHNVLDNVPSWFKNKEEADITIQQVEELFNCGVNVMMQHRTDGTVLLGVAKGGFNQRG